MANVMSAEKRVQILSLLCEGNSIRGTSRLVGSQIRTVLKQLVAAGQECQAFLNAQHRGLKLRHVEIDEIWTFCQKKERRLGFFEKNDPDLGDQYVFTALDQDSKLLVSFVVGKRNGETTQAFIDDLSTRVVSPASPNAPWAAKPQLSTDGWQSYPGAILESFGSKASHGVIIKNYAEPETGRYAPPELSNADRRNIQGIEHVRTICTSHVERHNLTIRTFMKRFTRLSLGFSRKMENLRAAFALFAFHYNYVRIHRSLKCTPAMAAGVTNRVWSLKDLVA